MSSFHLQIVTPDGSAYDGEAESLLILTSEGYVSILAGHADYIASLSIGEAVVVRGGKPYHAACGGGFVSVTSGEVRLVTTTFEYADDIDVERAEAARKRAEEKLKDEQDAKELEITKAKLMRALNRLNVAEK